ncbi:alpha/beta hydrolase [Lentzea sp.]|uniref:alpha/beta fold hydrolase n=1 Tax=Lentzea sp. TaxID=56099 RepID=UPI002ED0A40E
MSVVEFGGTGQGVLLLHGLMSRATAWWPVAQWLRPFGRVVALDQRGHGRNPRRGPFRTEDFVADAAVAVEELGLGPAVVVGHSMGGLHAWCLAATRPDLVRAIVVEDFAPDNRGRTVDEWKWLFDAWPKPFQSLSHVTAYFGSPVFAEYFEEREDGWHLIAEMDDLYEIAGHWGTRAYWEFIDAVRCPSLVIEAGKGGQLPGQMEEAARRSNGQYLYVEEAGHLVHDSAPWVYRGAVEAFLSTSTSPV